MAENHYSIVNGFQFENMLVLFLDSSNLLISIDELKKHFFLSPHFLDECVTVLSRMYTGKLYNINNLKQQHSLKWEK